MFFNEIVGPCLVIRGEIGQAMPCSSEGRELRPSFHIVEKETLKGSLVNTNGTDKNTTDRKRK